MIFRFRNKSAEPNVFAWSNDRLDWNLQANGDEQVEIMALGPTRQRTKWASMNSPVLLLRWRLGLFFVLLAFGLLAGRSAYLQVGQGGYYRGIADSNRTRTIVLPAHRGVIKDRNGLELAENIPDFRLLVWPKDISGWPEDELPDTEVERAAIIRESVGGVVTEIAQRLNLSATELLSRLNTAKPSEQVLLAESVSYEDALSFYAQIQDYPGFVLEFAERRQYYTSAIPTLSHVLGYTGPVNDADYEELRAEGYRRFDSLGKQGLEAWYETELRGQFGEEVLEVNAQGQALRVVSRREPVDGTDITLSLDAQLQAYIEVVLEEHLKTLPTQRASVVVMEPKTGEILALVSEPGFDANLFTNGISSAEYSALLNDPNTPLFPRAFAGEYPAGSTIKPMFAAAALADGIITPQTTFLSTGGVMLGNRFFPDWRPGGHGVTDVYHAIADSVNTFFYLIGGGNESFPGMGLEKLMTAALTFGFGQKTGVDLPGEADGFLPSKAWKQEAKGEPWYVGDTYNVSIGQGDFLATPVQVARATAVFANGGNLITPHLVQGSDQSSTNILADEYLQVVRRGMRQTITAGSARSLQSVPVTVAGKTGTAQWSSTKAPHSWFTGFAPFEEPEIVITVLVEQGGDETAALPITRDILTWYFANHE
ncbi:MAG: penicillin-binding protein 2 [Patescibacteria group bacterium]